MEMNFFHEGSSPHVQGSRTLLGFSGGRGTLHEEELEFKLSLFINKKIVLNKHASSMTFACEIFVCKLVAVSLIKCCFFFQAMVLLTLTAQQLLRRQFLL